MDPAKNKSEHEIQGGRTLSLWIDSYNDIFSDFDPRPFSERMISEDFIAQIKRASKEFRDKISVFKLLVPQGTQHEGSEKVIRRRLQSYFVSMHEQIADEMKNNRSRSLYFIVAGISLMLVSSYITYLKLSSFHFSVLLVLFEPGGWFLFWTGLDLFFSFSRSKKGETEFYSKLIDTHIEFTCYKG